MDIVYLFKADNGNDSEELRYSLRSLNNLAHGKVVIAGEKPDWARNVVHIPVPQTGTKVQNVAANLDAAIHKGELSDDFILMNDDFFIMKKIPAIPPLNMGTMRDVLDWYYLRYSEMSEYMNTMGQLYEKLIAERFDQPLSYELHVPMVMNVKNIQHLRQLANVSQYQFRSYYGNHFNIKSETTEDVKLFLEPSHNPSLYNENPDTYLASQTFLSVTGGAFKRGIAGQYIKNAFPEASIYES